MRLHESDYIRLWTIAGISQMDDLWNEDQDFSAQEENNISIPQEDKTILEGLIEVQRRIKEMIEKYELVQPEELVNSKVSATKVYFDFDDKLTLKVLVMKGGKNKIKPSIVEQESFGLFQSIPAAVDFYYHFVPIRVWLYVIDLLKQHTNTPMVRWIFKRLKKSFNKGYMYKAKNKGILHGAIYLNLPLLEGVLKILGHDSMEQFEQLETNESWKQIEVEVENKPNEPIESTGQFEQDFGWEVMLDFCCVIDKISSSASEDKENEDKRRVAISKTKNDTPEAKARKKRNEAIRQAIRKLTKPNGVLSQHAACEKYFSENEDFLKKNGIKSARTLENICSGCPPNKQRDEINRGKRIQAAFTGAEWRKFREAYENGASPNRKTRLPTKRPKSE